ncbi:MAG TPA: glycoside hydrolase, partial [Candidatus Omnitrophota bacterium]|nr:glycoside hydrolase [Candidatus Omnitrophota bacterium]
MFDPKKKLSVAFLWHMHQPFYKDTVTGEYLMPWVRLHGVKDYYPMAALIENFTDIKATFNMVPSLIEQIDDYARNDASDLFLELSRKKASGLSSEERCAVIRDFFHVNFKQFIEPSARYLELYMKRGDKPVTTAMLKNAAKRLTDQDLLDLQVLFNLAWFHSISIEEDINLKDIISKRESFTEEDKEYVLERQRDILSQIIPLYRKLLDEGRI